jgi:hypothetical protein
MLSTTKTTCEATNGWRKEEISMAEIKLFGFMKFTIKPKIPSSFY